MSTRLTEEQKFVHFLNRTSFGPTREEVQKVNRLGIPPTSKSNSILKEFPTPSQRRNSPV